MKRYLFILATAAALCVPAAALADATPNASQLAVQSCKTQQSQLGAATFKATYGANAYGKCVSKAMQSASAALQNAAEACKSEQADANFAAAHNGQTFNAVYGSGSSKGKGADANAYGKCVSLKAKVLARYFNPWALMSGFSKTFSWNSTTVPSGKSSPGHAESHLSAPHS